MNFTISVQSDLSCSTSVPSTFLFHWISYSCRFPACICNGGDDKFGVGDVQSPRLGYFLGPLLLRIFRGARESEVQWCCQTGDATTTCFCFGMWFGWAEKFPIKTWDGSFGMKSIKPFAVSAVLFFVMLGCGSTATRPVADGVTRTGDLLNGSITHSRNVHACIG